MKAILQSEFATIRSMGPSLVVTFVGVVAFLCFATESASMACAACAMYPMLITFSLMTYDNANGWERYRAGLPFSRRTIIAGRYASVLLTSIAAIVAAIALGAICQAVFGAFMDDFEMLGTGELAASCVASTALVLTIAAVMLPFMVKFGNTKGVRYAACAFMFAFALDIVVLSQVIDPDALSSLLAWVDSHGTAIIIGVVAATLALYAISCAISVRIFQKKDL